MFDTGARPALVAIAAPGEEGGIVLVELGVVEQRYDAVKEVLERQGTVTEVAERYGVTRQSLHNWLRRYRERGMAGLVDRSKRPRSCPHQTPARSELRVIELRREHPRWGPRRLAFELARKGTDPIPSPSSIYRILVRSGLVEPRARRRKRSDYLRWEPARPMELWQLDVMEARLKDGSAVKILTGVDDHSRFLRRGLCDAPATARPVCEAFAQALRAYGVPQGVLTDNGRVFTGRFAKTRHEVLFDRICRENGIRHLLTAVRSPTTTGKIERYHRSFETSCCRAGASPPSPRSSEPSTATSPPTTRFGRTRRSGWRCRSSGSAWPGDRLGELAPGLRHGGERRCPRGLAGPAPPPQPLPRRPGA